HDFFTEQPQKNVAVFLLRTVCHDWPDHLAVRILQLLRQAACPSTKLVIGDYIIPYSCSNVWGNIDLPGSEYTIPPEPLLANMGKASANMYWIDLSMQVLLNGQERTLPHHIRILHEAGWNPILLKTCRNSHFGYIIAECL
ncbi:uncharacterized protein C8R40DRAFT_1048066, partial [Lentinula edodes]|uniref:uncharacterized protein n=1 Tax=Lentinula edodes TaxID=5353 RepID=UPI001E8CF5F5